ncbi:hypothetical protein BATDEDRAFT_27772 [Batrachochytrium dendrobatidis JAM81]|uniref:PH domain-containing protein n=1 Tax=Batrachochytrium dendrobatidis (strain JAM81 / FGSC 10211) TaxID=684364 RepID=F4PBW9_BATDJ|nr:uncharacterized protein BATDEDRAFT_27772 [Batrachochytrium dendrobatidis JAM81]EGF77524.1 hypothetical protein BATDEDRAFT_27772 [Batrachochytrium dendrobatidis JAM81]|eukprot:XP_006681963.1 hypothetical protein BATDEDRAFT_27772 [Batrachochytrium dendrobatidis JAM81]
MTAVLRTYKSKYAIMIVNGLIENNFISNLLINNQQLCKILFANITVSGWKYGTDSNCCQSILSFNTARLTLTSCLTSHYLQRKTESRPDSLGMSTTTDCLLLHQDSSVQTHTIQCKSQKITLKQTLWTDSTKEMNIRVGLASFYEWQTSNYTKRLDQSRDMAKLLDTMEADKDWAIFRASNCDRFIDQDNVPLVDPANIIYDGCDDLAIRVVRQGSLLRKEGVFKRSYRPVNAVLSTSGYLHTLPPLSSTPIGATHSDTSSAGGPFSPTGNKPDFSADSILEMPELTLDLAEYTLLPLNLGDKDHKDIVFVEKNSGMFGRDIKHKFKGKTMVESAYWWTAINEHMKQMGTRTSVGTPTTQHSKPAFSGTAPLPKEGADGSTGLSQRAAASVATANAPSTSLQARLGAVVSHSKSDTIHATSGTRPVSMPAPPLPGRPKSTIVPTLRPKSGSLIDESFDDLPSRRDSLSPPISFTTTSNDQIPTPAHVADFASFPPPDTSDKTEVGNVSTLSLSEQMEMKLSHATSGGHSHDDPVELDTPSPKAKLASLSTGTSNPWDTFQDESGGW